MSGLLEGEEEGDMGLWFTGRNQYTFGAYLRVSFFLKSKGNDAPFVHVKL